MGTWILIIWIGGTNIIHSVPFDYRKSCEVALVTFKQAHPFAQGVCVQQNYKVGE